MKSSTPKSAPTLVFLAALLAIAGCAEEEQAVQSGMVLDVCGQQRIENPSDADIRRGLSDLDAATGEAFVIPGSDEMTYIQASGDKATGFDLEYQEGSTAKHYRAARTDISLEEILTALIAYRDGRGAWKEGFAFERITW